MGSKCYSYGGHGHSRKGGERICADYYGSKKRNHHQVRLRSISKKRRFDNQEMLHHHHHHHRSSSCYRKRDKKTDHCMTRGAKSCAKVEKDRPSYPTRKRLLHTTRSTAGQSITSSDKKKTYTSTELKAIGDEQESTERKMQIQREREAARIALDKMVKTVDLEDNRAVLREYGKLTGHLEFSLSTPSHCCTRKCHYMHALHFEF